MLWGVNQLIIVFTILNQPGVYVILFNKKEMEVTGETFSVQFEIIDPVCKPGKSKYFMAESWALARKEKNKQTNRQTFKMLTAVIFFFLNISTGNVFLR